MSSHFPGHPGHAIMPCLLVVVGHEATGRDRGTQFSQGSRHMRMGRRPGGEIVRPRACTSSIVIQSLQGARIWDMGYGTMGYALGKLACFGCGRDTTMAATCT